MNEDTLQKNNLSPISAEEFDALFDAGEDVSEYVDWEKGGLVAPGELSPGQVTSMLTMFNALSSQQKLIFRQTILEAVLGDEASLSVPMPWLLYSELAREAQRRQTSREMLVQSWIAQHLQSKEAVK